MVRDLVTKAGDLAEATDDWYAQAKDKNIWYCGEEIKNFENFDGDDPRRPELVSIEGSFKAGRDGDKRGIIFLTGILVSASRSFSSIDSVAARVIDTDDSLHFTMWKQLL